MRDYTIQIVPVVDNRFKKNDIAIHPSVVLVGLEPHLIPVFMSNYAVCTVAEVEIAIWKDEIAYLPTNIQKSMASVLVGLDRHLSSMYTSDYAVHIIVVAVISDWK
jgi:hypothetical protein